MPEIGIYGSQPTSPHTHASPVQGGQLSPATALNPSINRDCRVYKNGNQSINAGATAKITAWLASIDAGADFDIANSKYICPANGRLLVYAQLAFLLMADAKAANCHIYKGGAEIAKGYQNASLANASPMPSVLNLINVAIGDQIEIYGTNGDAAARDVSGDTKISYAVFRYLLP